MSNGISLDAIDLRSIADRIHDAAMRCDSEMQANALLVSPDMFGPRRQNLTGYLGDWAISETDADSSLDKNISAKADHIVETISAFTGQSEEHKGALEKAGM